MLKTSSKDELIQNLQEDYIRDEMSEIKSDEDEEAATMSESKKSSAEKKRHNSRSGNKSSKDSSGKSRRHGSARSRDSSSKSSDRSKSKRKKSGNEGKNSVVELQIILGISNLPGKPKNFLFLPAFTKKFVDIRTFSPSCKNLLCGFKLPARFGNIYTF